MTSQSCPTNDEWLKWLRDPFESDGNQRLANHLDSCAACQQALHQLTDGVLQRTTSDTDDDLIADLRRQVPAASFEEEPECVRSGDFAVAALITQTALGSTTREACVANVKLLPEVGNYKILGVLGQGGMGVVYQARHTNLNRTAAIKMILGGKYSDPVAQARFLIEAEVIARLRHPHIVQVFEFGRCDDQPYFVLEFMEGGSLAGKLKAEGRFSPNAAAAMVAKLADAMATAHAQGVIHRDLKPANILLTETGEPKVADFGLAKFGDSGTTASGSIIGTPNYMSPEQAAGKTKEIGTAADVYALGAILYALLTGRPPFTGETAIDTILQVLAKEPDQPQTLVPGVPRDLGTICLKCLEKRPEKRYASAAFLAEDLARYLQGKPIKARPVSRFERTWKWIKRNPVVTGATVAVVLALIAGTTVSYLKYRDAERQKGIAEAKAQVAVREAARANKARQFLVSIFELSDVNNPQGAMNARQILADAERRIPTEFADQPELQAELMGAIDAIHAKMNANSPLAMILEARGEVRRHSTRDANPQALPQTLLYAGDRLSLAADAQVRLVFLSDLHKEWLEPGKEVAVRRRGCEPADAIREREDDILMSFVRLPKGTFYMGGGGGIAGARTEIEEDFEIGVHLVVQGQWQQIMGNNPSSFSRFGPDYAQVLNISDEELKLFPVECVAADDIQQFLVKLNERYRGRGWLYRLPTSAEWEYACRAGATTSEECSYHFYFPAPTNAISSNDANFNGAIPFGEAPIGMCLDRPTRVGAYPPNRLGLCDMHGNLSQWCSDSFGNLQVHRGGAWGSTGFHCRAAERNECNRWDRTRAIGFRLVRVPAP